MDEKKKKNEELQTRREFFKKAARKMLPMLGAVVVGPTIIASTLTSCDKCIQQSCGCKTVQGGS